MTTTRSLLCEAVTAGWISEYRQRFLSRLLTASRRLAAFLENERWSYGRMSYPCLRARLIDLRTSARLSDRQTTRVSPTGFPFSAEARLRNFGTLPPVHGLMEQSAAGSGQYDARSMWACATTGTSSATT